MKQEAVRVEQKKVAAVVYALLLLAAVFALGWFAGTNAAPAEIQVMTQPAAQSMDPGPAAPEQAGTKTAELIDLNTADQQTLQTLPGIGPELASRIVAYRERIGAFVTKEQIMDVEGIGEKRFAEMENLITVGGAP